MGCLKKASNISCQGGTRGVYTRRGGGCWGLRWARWRRSAGAVGVGAGGRGEGGGGGQRGAVGVGAGSRGEAGRVRQTASINPPGPPLSSLRLFCRTISHANVYKGRDDSRFTPSQWETALLCNDVSHWLDISLDTALGLALLTLSWDKNWDSHSLVNGYPSFYPRIPLVAPSPERVIYIYIYIYIWKGIIK